MAGKEYLENMRKIIDLTTPVPGGKILDVGCSEGTFTLRIAKRAGASFVYGMEIDPERSKVARAKKILVEESDANGEFPYGDSFFDAVYSNQTVEHLLQTDNFFREIYRVLKPGGYAIISTQNLASFHNTGMLLLGMQPISLNLSDVQVGNFLYGTEAAGHIKVFTLPALVDLSRRQGFHLEKTYSSGLYPLPPSVSRIAVKMLKRYGVFIGVKIRKPHENTSRDQKIP